MTACVIDDVATLKGSLFFLLLFSSSAAPESGMMLMTGTMLSLSLSLSLCAAQTHMRRANFLFLFGLNSLIQAAASATLAETFPHSALPLSIHPSYLQARGSPPILNGRKWTDEHHLPPARPPARWIARSQQKSGQNSRR